MNVVIKRHGERMRFTLTPAADSKQGFGYLKWLPETDVRVSTVESGYAAFRAGLKPGDILVSANGLPLRSTARLHEIEHDTDGRPLDVVYSRAGVENHVTITPEKRDPDGGGQRWVIGLNLEPRIDYTKLPVRQAFAKSLDQNAEGAAMIFQFLERIVERRMSPKSLVGPVGIAQLSGQAAKEGVFSYLELMAMVSLNLAIVNLLPIPILDGGVILMLLIEMLMRRDLDLRMKEAVVKVGFVFLMVVVVFAIYNDISRMLPG
jgi:regulator of sigma E protease